jgi:hypothetical protein
LWLGRNVGDDLMGGDEQRNKPERHRYYEREIVREASYGSQDESGTNLLIAKVVCKEKTDLPRTLKIQSEKRAVWVIKKGGRNWLW